MEFGTNYFGDLDLTDFSQFGKGASSFRVGMLRKKKQIRRSSVRIRTTRSRRASASASRPGSRRGSRVTGRISRVRASRKRTVKRPVTFVVSPQHVAAIRNFESGVRMFQRQNFSRAREIFEKLAVAAPLEVGSRATAYVKMCDQKLPASAPVTRSGRDYYDLGVTQLNARELDAAFESLTRADKAAPRQEYIRYALAAVCALRGSAEAALEHLAAAIDLRRANRSLAAQDQDFQSLFRDSRFQKLIRSGVA